MPPTGILTRREPEFADFKEEYKVQGPRSHPNPSRVQACADAVGSMRSKV